MSICLSICLSALSISISVCVSISVSIRLYLSVYLCLCLCLCQLMFHQRGILLDQNLYHLVCTSLNDNYEGVRLAAVKLVCVFSLVYPEQSVTSHDFI